MSRLPGTNTDRPSTCEVPRSQRGTHCEVPRSQRGTHCEVPRSQRGTTMVELMIGLVIIMILSAMAVPGTAGIVRAYNLRAAADQLVYAVDLARGQSMANRRAYGIQFADPKVGGRFSFNVIQGKDATCASIVGGTVVKTVDMGVANLNNDPAIQIVDLAPIELKNGASFPCFKSDGRVIRADNGLTYSAPGGTTLGGGDIVLQLQRVEGTALIGTALQVQIGYNGSARVVFGRPIAALQGSGKGGAP